MGILLSKRQIAKCMLNDLNSYEEYIEEWLVAHLEENPHKQISWDAWFRGAKEEAINQADKGIIYIKN